MTHATPDPHSAAAAPASPGGEAFEAFIRENEPKLRRLQVRGGARRGNQVIGGVRVEQLRATRLGHLPGLGALPGDAAPIGRVTSLNVWVDSRSRAGPGRHRTSRRRR
jgi:hypothetical protein